MPWYAPVLGTVGVLLMICSVIQRPGILRIAGVILFAAVCGIEWTFVVMSKTPAYTGPATTGQTLPSFAAVRADGQPFTNASLAEGASTVLLFFRGRW